MAAESRRALTVHGRIRRRPALTVIDAAATPDGPARESPSLGQRGIIETACPGGLTRIFARTRNGHVIGELVIDAATCWSMDDIWDGVHFLEKHLERVDPAGPRLED